MVRKSGAMTRRENGAKKCGHCGEPVKMKALAGHIKACERKVAAAAKLKAKEAVVGHFIGGQQIPVIADFGNMI